MNPLNGIEDFIRRCPFVAGVYEVHALDCAGQGLLLRLRFADKDEPLRDGVRQVATIELPQCNFVLPPQRPTSDQAEAEDIHQRVFSALVRAGAQHPGLRVEDLRRLHQAARREHYIELFSDLNALTTGLLGHLVGSLGTRVSRVVVASSSIDILHEYQSLSRHSRRAATRSCGDGSCSRTSRPVAHRYSRPHPSVAPRGVPLLQAQGWRFFGWRRASRRAGHICIRGPTNGCRILGLPTD